MTHYIVAVETEKKLTAKTIEKAKEEFPKATLQQMYVDLVGFYDLNKSNVFKAIEFLKAEGFNESMTLFEDCGSDVVLLCEIAKGEAR